MPRRRPVSSLMSRRSTVHRRVRKLSAETLERRLLLTTTAFGGSGDVGPAANQDLNTSEPAVIDDVRVVPVVERSVDPFSAAQSEDVGPSVEVSIFAVFEKASVGSLVGVVRAASDSGSLVFRLREEGNTDVDGDGERPFQIDADTGELLVNDSGDLDLALLPIPLFGLRAEVEDSEGRRAEAAQVVEVIPPPAELSVEGVTAVEGEDLVFSITLDRAVEAAFDVVVRFLDDSATGGGAPLESPSDYHNSSRTLSFAGSAGETHQVMVSTLDDELAEAAETFRVELDALDPLINDRNTANGTITDNDSASLTVDDATVTEGGDLLFTITLQGAVQAPFDVDVNFSDATATGGSLPLVSPSDYNRTPRSIRFSGDDGESRQFTVSTLADEEAEEDETFSVRLTSSDSTVDDSDTGTGTIGNNRPPEIENQSFVVAEHVEAGAVIGKVAGSDPEGGDLVYSLVRNANPNRNPSTAVQLDPTTGELTVRDPRDFDFELASQLVLTVRVAEPDPPSLSALATVEINITDANDAPIIAPIANIRTSDSSVQVTVLGVDPDADQDFVANTTFEIVSVRADGITPLQQAVFDARLVIDNGTLYFNEFGGQEKWLRSATTGGWYFILPNDRIYQWDNSTRSLSGDLLGVLDPAVYDDPSLILVDRLAGPLANPQNVPVPAGTAAATVSGNVVTVESNDFAGIAEVTVRATDLNGAGLSDEETFLVEFAPENRAPELAEIGSRQSAPGGLTIEVPLTATDPDGDSPLVFDARLRGPIPATVSIVDDLLTITRRGRFFRPFMVTVTVSDGHGGQSEQTFEASFLPVVPAVAGRGLGQYDFAELTGNSNELPFQDGWPSLVEATPVEGFPGYHPAGSANPAVHGGSSSRELALELLDETIDLLSQSISEELL